MRYLFLAMLVVASAPTSAGPIFAEFGSGYDGVTFGLPLADLVGMMPEGEHYFANAPGQRDYAVRNDAPLLGVPRSGTRVHYYLDKNDRVENIAISIPYDQHQQLLGVLIAQFGRYSQAADIGVITHYWWKEDQQIRIGLRVSKDPRYGIAEFTISRGSADAPKANCK
jgi:hypothetical protein